MKTVMLAAARCAANPAWADTSGTLTGQSFSVDYTTYTHCVQIGCPNEPPPQIDGDSVLWPISYFRFIFTRTVRLVASKPHLTSSPCRALSSQATTCSSPCLS